MTDNPASARWEARYGERQVWSGHVNDSLRLVAEGLATGSALDLACGEGGDAVWLAQQGWTVTAVDFAENALARLREAAVSRGVSERVTTLRADLAQWSADASFDLVSCHFLHESEDVRRHAFRAAAAATASGGTLLIAGHSLSEDESLPGPPAERRWDPAWAVEAAGLDEGWLVVTEQRDRRNGHHGLEVATRTDALVMARRR
jgi:SAM-dependent methyltransferase